MNSYVLGFAFFKHLVLLMEKQRPDWQKGLLNGVGGKMKSYELPIHTMVREFKEETGTLTHNDEWEHVITLVSQKHDSIVYIFKAIFHFDFTADIVQTDEPVQMYEPENMHAPVVPHLKWMIPLILSDIDFPVTVIEKKAKK